MRFKFVDLQHIYLSSPKSIILSIRVFFFFFFVCLFVFFFLEGGGCSFVFCVDVVFFLILQTSRVDTMCFTYIAKVQTNVDSATEEAGLSEKNGIE